MDVVSVPIQVCNASVICAGIQLFLLLVDIFHKVFLEPTMTKSMSVPMEKVLQIRRLSSMET